MVHTAAGLTVTIKTNGNATIVTSANLEEMGTRRRKTHIGATRDKIAITLVDTRAVEAHFMP